MIYSLLTYEYKNNFNVGDYIQSIAARQFLPRVDQYINRERLNEYNGPETQMIMNGWFMFRPDNWPPPPNINPLFISFYLNPIHAEKILSEQGVAYLRKHEVGCRTYSTLKLMKEMDIDAYYSGCLTMTLGNSYRNISKEDIYFVDVSYKLPSPQKAFRSFGSFRKSVRNREIFRLGQQKKLIRKLFGDEIIDAAKNITHCYPAEQYTTVDSRFKLAEDLLKRYQKAKLVVTSRIHCALPCLAMGTPVIFVYGGFDHFSSQCRLEDPCRLLNTIYIDGEKKHTNFDYENFRKTGQINNKTDHLEYLELLNQQAKKFINNTEE